MSANPVYSGRGSRERGVVLLLSLIALLLIAAVGAAILFMASSESSIVGNQRLAARVTYAAEGGLEEARFRLRMPVPPAAGGLNFSSTPQLGFPAPVLSCTPTEQPGTLAPCNTVDDAGRYPARPENVLYILNTAAAAPGSVANAPASPTNDPTLGNEITNPIINTTPSIQPGAGGLGSVPYAWVRINLKTELASGQDINFDNNLDEEPIFYFEDRQYQLTDMLAIDPTALPPPWGPPAPPGLARPCLGLACAAPVYMLTAFSTVAAPNAPGRLERMEVATSLSYSVDAGIFSIPPIQVSGTSQYIGYDGCNPLCPAAPPFPAGPPPGCNFVVPLQTQDNAASDVSGAAADTYPAPPCPPPSVSSPGNSACIQQGVAAPYNVNDLIARFLPADVVMAPGNYSGITLGTFPSADPVGGADAVPQITRISGDFKCTGGCTGAGVLIVAGDLQFNASMEFYGLIIARGNITGLGGGAPASGCNFYGGLISGGGVQTTVGGALCYWYNSCAQNISSRKAPVIRLSYRSMPG